MSKRAHGTARVEKDRVAAGEPNLPVGSRPPAEVIDCHGLAGHGQPGHVGRPAGEGECRGLALIRRVGAGIVPACTQVVLIDPDDDGDLPSILQMDLQD
jgi:hypothetical protein